MSHEPSDIAVDIRNVGYAYGDAVALRDVTFAVPRGEIFGLVGPNGGGKSTLFRLLSTLVALQSGDVRVFGLDLRSQRAQVRPRMGVVFQSPALDGKLSVEENLRHQGHLYGLRGAVLRERIDQGLRRFGLADRRRQRTEFLSGGLQRRVELAKSLLHAPQVLILDEPSTGLDPGARHDLWSSLEEVRRRDGVTVLMTTHILEEAEGCDQVAVLDQGRLVVTGAPQELEAQLGGDVISIRAADLRQLSASLAEEFGLHARQVGAHLRVQHADGAELLQRIMTRFGASLDAVTLARPTLEDVFIHYTGHEFNDDETKASGSGSTPTAQEPAPSGPRPRETADR
jgi:ABC-2 type transport system ATP-binding protein